MLNACEDDHDDIILGKPFLKLVNAILDVGKGVVTLELDGIKHDFDFFSQVLVLLHLYLSMTKR